MSIAPSAPVATQEAARDAGLLRKMGVIALAASIVNEVVGAGIFRLPAAMAASAGSHAPLAYIACLVAMGAVVICFAEAGSRVPTSGGPYGYVEAAFGPLAGFVTGVLVYLAAVLACGGLAAAFADAVGSALPVFTNPLAHGALAIAVLALLAWVNMRGVETATRFISTVTFIKLMPLVLFVVVGGVALLMRAPEAAAATPELGIGDDFGRAVILAMFALSGMETPLGASGEVAQPARTIPRAILLGMGLVGVLYILIQIVADGLMGPALATSKTPLADAIATVAPALRVVLLGGAAFSALCWLASDLLGAPRTLFAFARDGLLPAGLGVLHPKTHVPARAIIVHTLLASLLAVTGTFVQLAVLSALATAGIYLFACAAAWALARRGVAILGTPLAFRLLPLASVIGIVAMVALVALGEWLEIVALIGVIAASAVYFWAVRRRAA
ncbi:APC family permease [Sphingomonas naphthae]|uniref:Arginine/agmatine antiporter n=1 Tax=Sphingomonas naphthae TaxID=1813468 RepID=A0ABY7TI00_9SPHN|nr:APC family permease [Sphingomonas naphthae]WCT72570.1 APC family permease [Sphingomonas naphthae]